MRRIGLLGGMSFEGSATYYRLINEAVRERFGGLTSADLVLRSVNFARLVEMQRRGRWGEIGAELAEGARDLERGGAECVLVCAVTMHLVAEAIEGAVSVPLLHVIDETGKVLRAQGRRRPLLLATRYTMEDGFYQARMRAQGVEVMIPDDAGRAATHAIIFDELCQGKILDRSRDVLVTLIETAGAAGADSVIFGCTEIGLILDPSTLPLAGFDSTVIHAAAAVAFALGDVA